MLAVVVDWDLAKKYAATMPPWQWAIVVLVGSIGVWCLFQLRAWFREDDGRADGHLEMLTQFRDLHRQGGISEDEYRLIKSQLVTGQAAQMRAGQRPSRPANSASGESLPNPIVGPRRDTAGESSTGDDSPTKDADEDNQNEVHNGLE